MAVFRDLLRDLAWQRHEAGHVVAFKFGQSIPTYLLSGRDMRPPKMVTEDDFKYFTDEAKEALEWLFYNGNGPFTPTGSALAFHYRLLLENPRDFVLFKLFWL